MDNKNHKILIVDDDPAIPLCGIYGARPYNINFLAI